MKRSTAALDICSRSAIQIVPSVVTRMERNIVINGTQTDFRMIKVGLETPIWWDEKLFGVLPDPCSRSHRRMLVIH